MHDNPSSTRRGAARLALVLVLAAGGMTACGSSSAGETTSTDPPGSAMPTGTEGSTPGDGADPASGRQSQIDIVVERMVRDGAAAGVTLDPECVAGVAGALSDEDLALLVGAAATTEPDTTDPQLSAEGDALAEQLFGCIQSDAPAALIEQATQRVLDSPDGGVIDGDCLRRAFAVLSEDQLQLIIDAAPDSTDPKLTMAAGIVLSCADLSGDTSGAADTTVLGGAASAIGPCDLLTAEQVATIFVGLDAGKPMNIVRPYGSGTGCEWTGDGGISLTVDVIAGADVAAWAAESTDGDGLDDGAVVTGVGDVAYGARATLGFAVGTTLVTINAFPSFDVTPESIAALAVSIAATLSSAG